MPPGMVLLDLLDLSSLIKKYTLFAIASQTGILVLTLAS